jgi:predicted nucleotidyltransferase
MELDAVLSGKYGPIDISGNNIIIYEPQDDWQVIKKKEYKSPKKVEVYNPSLDELKENIISALLKYNPHSIFIYGSRARQTNKPTSDADILVVWKNKSPGNLREIKQEIIDKVKIPIDFVNLLYKSEGKETKINDLRDIAYYDNVLVDAINIYSYDGKKKFLNDIIPYSRKLKKI